MPDTESEEYFLDNYWVTVVGLLKMEVPWELISTVSDKDIVILIGTVQAFRDYENEQQEREMRRSNMGI